VRCCNNCELKSRAPDVASSSKTRSIENVAPLRGRAASAVQPLSAGCTFEASSRAVAAAAAAIASIAEHGSTCCWLWLQLTASAIAGLHRVTKSSISET
jgi:hypothetical protein